MADQKTGRVSLSGLPKRSFLPSFVQIRQRLGQLTYQKPTNGGVPHRNLRVASRPFFFVRTALKKGTTSLRSVVKQTFYKHSKVPAGGGDLKLVDFVPLFQQGLKPQGLVFFQELHQEKGRIYWQ